MQVELFKKSSEYVDKEGNQKTATNFYVRCGDVFIPIEVSYFADKVTGRDDKYKSRKDIVKAFSTPMPTKS